jgi:ribose transport system substrate-binding protein
MKVGAYAGAGAVAAAIAWVLTACQPAAHEENETYMLIASNISLPYWQEAVAGFRDAGRDLRVKVDIQGPQSYSPDEEVDDFQQAVKKHPAGILVSPASADKFTAPIDAAIAAGIPVICIDSDAPNSRRLMFIGTDNVRAGQESGRRIAQLMHDQGDLVVITIPGQLNLEQRMQGLKAIVSGYPRIKIAQVLDDKGDPRLANDEISALLEKKAKVDGIVCLEASGGAGAAEALHRLNLDGKIPIVAMDKDAETLDWISRGGIAATVSQKPYTMAFYGLKFLDDLHHNVVHEFRDWRTAPVSPLPTLVDTGTAVIDSTNLKEFQAAVAEHPKPL